MDNTITITLSYAHILFLIVVLPAIIGFIVLHISTKENDRTMKFCEELLKNNHKVYDEMFEKDQKIHMDTVRINKHNIEIINGLILARIISDDSHE